MSFDPGVVEMFMFKWAARLYAWRARRAGYKAEVVDEGTNWLLNGGRWGVKLGDKNE